MKKYIILIMLILFLIPYSYSIIVPQTTSNENMYYAQIWNRDSNYFYMIDLPSPDVYVPLKNLTNSNLYGFESDTENITALYEGWYKLDAQASVESDGNGEIGCKIFVNNISRNQCYSHLDLSINSHDICIVSCILYLNQSDKINFQFDDHENPPTDIDFVSANINIISLDTSNNTFTDGNVTIDLSNYYTKSESDNKFYSSLSNFTNGLVNGKICLYNSSSSKIECTYTDLVGNGTTNITVDLSNYYNKSQVYNKSETYNKSEADNLFISDGNTGWNNIYGFITSNEVNNGTSNLTILQLSSLFYNISNPQSYITNLTMNKSVLWSSITDKPTFNNGTSNLTLSDINNSFYDKNTINSMNNSLQLNDSNLLTRINNINTSSNIESLGFNTTTKLKTYFDTLYYALNNPQAYITNLTMNKSVLWSSITDKPTFNNGTSNLTVLGLSSIFYNITNPSGYITNTTMNKSVLWSSITDKPTFNNGTSNLTLSQIATAIQNTTIAHININVTNKICTWNGTTNFIDCNYTDQTGPGSSISFDSKNYSWKEPVIEIYDNSISLPTNNAGDRYIALTTANGWTQDYIYEGTGSTWIELIPQDGDVLFNLYDYYYLMYSAGWTNFIDGLDITGVNHYGLGGLQGGSPPFELYHLSANQYNNLFTNISNFTTNLVNGKICIYNSSTPTKIQCDYTDQTGTGSSDPVEVQSYMPNSQKFPTLIEEFLNTNNFNINLVGTATSSGTIAIYSVTTIGQERPGIVALRDSTTANGGYRLITDTSAFLFKGNETAEFIFMNANEINSSIKRMGWWDSGNIAEATDGCYLNITRNTITSPTNLIHGTCASNNARTQTSTNYTISNTTWYVGKISVNSNATNVYFELRASNYTRDLLWSSNITTNIPKTSGRVTGFGVGAYEASTNAATNLLMIDYISLQINRTLNR